MFSLSGRSVAVTGAGSGIGLAIAELFAAQGATVALLDLNLDKAGQEAARIGGGAYALGLNVSDSVSVAEAFATMQTPADTLVNCAGIAHVGSLMTTSAADLDRLYQVNVRGTALCMQAAVPAMIAAKRGVIVNLASIAATAGLSDRFAYSMTKGAVLAMTLSAARDLLVHGVRCNCISPARVHTPFVDGFLAKNYPGQEAEKMKALAASQPIGRMGQPAEVAALALYLCSDEASFVTGVDYPLDGGFMNLR